MGWGVEEFRPITNMPGFTHYAPIAKVYPDAIGVAVADFNGDGKPDLCLYGANKVVLLKNGGDTFDEVALGLEGDAARRPGPITTATASPTCCWPPPPGHGCSATKARVSATSPARCPASPTRT